jgi:hypothetical protein
VKLNKKILEKIASMDGKQVEVVSLNGKQFKSGNGVQFVEFSDRTKAIEFSNFGVEVKTLDVSGLYYDNKVGPFFVRLGLPF